MIDVVGRLVRVWAGDEHDGRRSVDLGYEFGFGFNGPTLLGFVGFSICGGLWSG